jgi:hypothetical protein
MNRYEAPPTLTEILLPRERPHIDYRQVFAWKPVLTAEGLVWLRPVWKMTVDGAAVSYTKSILPLGWHK